MKLKNIFKKNIHFLYFTIIIYLIIGIGFVVARANSHYKTIVEDKGVFFEGQSYWDARCIEENNKVSIIYGTPGAKWCLDNAGNFHTEKPSKLEWFFMFYGKKYSDLSVLVIWPIHFIGLDIIHFKSIAGVWQYG